MPKATANDNPVPLIMSGLGQGHETASAEYTVKVQQQFVRNQSKLKAFVLALQPDFAEAEDILQEVFLVVTRKAHDFREGSNFLAWAIRICRLKVYESYRKTKSSAMLLSEEVMDKLCEFPPEPYLNEDRSLAVRECLDKLAPNMREIMRLRYYSEQGPAEIARQLSWSTNSVNVTLSKARKLMQACVGKRLKDAS